MKTIMTVDDSSTIRQMVSLVLTEAGFKVIEAVDGVDALHKLADASVDLIVADVNMPNMDGMELTQKVRTLPDYKFVPILILTTESDISKRQQAKAAGATGWLVKPFKPDQFVMTIRKVLPD